MSCGLALRGHKTSLRAQLGEPAEIGGGGADAGRRHRRDMSVASLYAQPVQCRVKRELTHSYLLWTIRLDWPEVSGFCRTELALGLGASFLVTSGDRKGRILALIL